MLAFFPFFPSLPSYLFSRLPLHLLCPKRKGIFCFYKKGQCVGTKKRVSKEEEEEGGVVVVVVAAASGLSQSLCSASPSPASSLRRNPVPLVPQPPQRPLRRLLDLRGEGGRLSASFCCCCCSHSSSSRSSSSFPQKLPGGSQGSGRYGVFGVCRGTGDHLLPRSRGS